MSLEKKLYQTPAVIYETNLEVRAGTTTAGIPEGPINYDPTQQSPGAEYRGNSSDPRWKGPFNQ